MVNPINWLIFLFAIVPYGKLIADLPDSVLVCTSTLKTNNKNKVISENRKIVQNTRRQITRAEKQREKAERD